MIEVFKTNVTKPVHAAVIISTIKQIQNDYSVNFDLEDCDCIMRVKSTQKTIDTALLIRIVCRFGFDAHVLQDQPYERSKKLSNHNQFL